MTTTNGILSRNADSNAATQRRSTAVSKTCDPAKLARACAAAFNTPAASSPPTAINKEVKNSSTFQSTALRRSPGFGRSQAIARSEEHTSELQSPYDLVC